MKNLMFLFLLYILAAAPSAAAEKSSTPFREILDKPTTFTGIKKNPPFRHDKIVLGFLLPEDEVIAEVIRRASTKAVALANLDGGYRGTHFSTAYRSADSPWKAGPSEAVKLVYMDSAHILLTSLSPASHVASQIAAKSFLPVISLHSGDATLNQARLPWIFRLAPEFKAQLKLLAEHSLKNDIRSTGLISTLDHESRMAARSSIEILSEKGLPPAFHYQLDTDPEKWPDHLVELANGTPDAIFICTARESFLQIVQLLGSKGLRCPLYLVWTPGLDLAEAMKLYHGKTITVSPSSAKSCTSIVENGYLSSGEVAGAVFDLAYDGTQLAIDAVMKNGPQSKALRDSLALLKNYTGSSADYLFDNGGGNTSPPRICEYTN